MDDDYEVCDTEQAPASCGEHGYIHLCSNPTEHDEPHQMRLRAPMDGTRPVSVEREIPDDCGPPPTDVPVIVDWIAELVDWQLATGRGQ